MLTIDGTRFRRLSLGFIHMSEDRQPLAPRKVADAFE